MGAVQLSQSELVAGRGLEDSQRVGSHRRHEYSYLAERSGYGLGTVQCRKADDSSTATVLANLADSISKAHIPSSGNEWGQPNNDGPGEED